MECLEIWRLKRASGFTLSGWLIKSKCVIKWKYLHVVYRAVDEAKFFKCVIDVRSFPYMANIGEQWPELWSARKTRFARTHRTRRPTTFCLLMLLICKSGLLRLCEFKWSNNMRSGNIAKLLTRNSTRRGWQTPNSTAGSRMNLIHHDLREAKLLFLSSARCENINRYWNFTAKYRKKMKIY